MKILKYLVALLLIPRSAGEPKESTVLAKAQHKLMQAIGAGSVILNGMGLASQFAGRPLTVLGANTCNLMGNDAEDVNNTVSSR
ncbi:MAG: hypothetical protein HY080_07325 [Gammaproteobacteria bacterium]|nr:hypothetical protein [Gammaproteobacteria bacterium]